MMGRRLFAGLLLLAVALPARAQEKTVPGLLRRIYRWKLEGGKLQLATTEERPDFFGEARALGMSINYNWDNGSGSGGYGAKGERLFLARDGFNVSSMKRKLRLSCDAPREGGALTLVLSPPDGRLVVFNQSAGRLQLVILEGERSTVAVAADFSELARRHTAALQTFDELLARHLFPLPAHPLRRQVIDLALRGFDPLPAALAREWQARVEQLGDKQFKQREAATAALRTQLRGGDPRTYRFLEAAGAASANPEVKARIKSLLAQDAALQQAYRLVVARRLERDLPYLIELLGHTDATVRDAAGRRLQRLTGEQLAPEAWTAWHKRVSGRLVWDAAAGVYVQRKK